MTFTVEEAHTLLNAKTLFNRCAFDPVLKKVGHEEKKKKKRTGILPGLCGLAARKWMRSKDSRGITGHHHLSGLKLQLLPYSPGVKILHHDYRSTHVADN